MVHDLKIVLYPDPRLKKMSSPVTTFDDELKAIAARMFELMREHRGVGLAAPQVGLNVRMFVMNATGEDADDRVYVNPQLLDAEGEEEGEEGCLSIPQVNARIWRSEKLRMVAQDLDGKPFEEIGTDLVARIWQHETDHLNGTLITERMGPVARLAARRVLKELTEKFEEGKGKKK
ncbi:MAG TPA: peptide deformylase [Tepidisphaeraceae bacterium]|nr:peptide deformylase [Tepidisphaeraceae bacterium]